ncbi:salivary glue protein Sgs-3 isoform X2 [Eurytemora carolleeae]|uniref:salivary glue protein Sgs-3 isoform X2 n=1 Tax=Eurytemora carolleeae TaxID=1294199 RepID=UPI000C78D70D|nr:salivary glue protein Sgs-3 isoform X2 [Eurytemora carolleeae]|eukprot:XP_023342524.1 salivary glue protein Sgs-3-like isoform X2 [Eurytemora affinis]
MNLLRTHWTKVFVYSCIAICFTLSGSQGQNNFIPPYLKTCTALPNNGGRWNCIPEAFPGFPVQTDTSCEFWCNGIISDTLYRCDKHAHWNHNPNQETCQETTTIRPSSTSTTTPITSVTTTEATTLTTTADLTTPTTTTSSTPTTTETTPTTTTSTTTTTTSTTTVITTTEMTSTTETTTTTLELDQCPFTLNEERKSRSLYCPQSYCPAVKIVSRGGAAKEYPNLMGCYNYEGSLMGDEYPNYVNKGNVFLTPHSHSNPVIGYTIWLVSTKVLDTTGYIRNNKHDDLYCPYDMLDGWEYLDKAGNWVEDETLKVECVHGSY